MERNELIARYEELRRQCDQLAIEIKRVEDEIADLERELPDGFTSADGR